MTASGIRLTPEEWRRLRWTALEVEDRALAAEQARLALRRLLLQVEQAHGLAGVSARLDLETGWILMDGENDGPERDADASPA